MSKYQLWSRDEYGQGSIVLTSEDIDEVIKKGKEEVTNANVSNALTADDRARNWEAYMVNIVSGNEDYENTKYVYGGPHAKATDTIYRIAENAEDIIKLSEVPSAVVRIYLGNISTDRNKEEDWFACDVARKVIDNIIHQDLADKTMYFVKKI